MLVSGVLVYIKVSWNYWGTDIFAKVEGGVIILKVLWEIAIPFTSHLNEFVYVHQLNPDEIVCISLLIYLVILYLQMDIFENFSTGKKNNSHTIHNFLYAISVYMLNL